MTTHVIRSEDAPVHHQDWGSLQWLVGGTVQPHLGLTIGRVTFEPGEANPPHRHPNCDEVLHVVQGTLEHTRGDGTFVELRPGDSIVLDRDRAHYARNVGTGEAVALVIFNAHDRQVVGE